MPSRPAIMSILHRCLSCFCYLRRCPPAFWCLSPSFIHWSVGTWFPKMKKLKKNAGPLDATPPSPLFPPWTLGPAVTFVSQGEKRSGANQREQHMERIGAAGKRRMENDKTGCPSSFSLNTGPKSILLPAWDFPQPKFWVNPISCPQDWDVVCQRWQSSPIMGDTVQHF